MKAVILLAGMGRRIIESIEVDHKSLIIIDKKPVIFHILKNIEKTLIKDIVLVLGYNGDKILRQINQFRFPFAFKEVWNNDYAVTNNLYSLLQAKNELMNQEFIIINGDMVFDEKILEDIIKLNGSRVATDLINSSKYIDSPGVSIQNDKIIDLGRHINEKNRNGYAVGIYKISKEHSFEFFSVAEKLIKKNKNSGFHDPLNLMFDNNSILPSDVKNYSWMDVDDASDILKAKKILKKIKENSL